MTNFTEGFSLIGDSLEKTDPRLPQGKLTRGG